MLTIDQTIAAAAAIALAGAGTFIHESQVEATITANNAALPVVVYGTATTTQKQASSKVEAARVTLYFATSTPGAGDNAAARMATQQQMQALKRQFLTVLDAAPLVEVDNINATPMASIYEAVLDGIGCAFDLTVPANGLLTICTAPPVTIPTVTAPTVTSATFTGDTAQVIPLVTNAIFTGDTTAVTAPTVTAPTFAAA